MHLIHIVYMYIYIKGNRKRPGWHETDSQVDWDFNWADVAWIRENYDHKQFEGEVCYVKAISMYSILF